ncbi:MAG TPA: zinc-ribbon domain-containing protein [Nitrososphaera sp.]|jgi:sporulation protein YlmC with PRC-barrel domain|nr:zinc-ribbon domain-containing protein [Nitrososphaera sp.]
MIAEDMTEKKLRGSGGYAIARVTDEEQKKGNLGGPELFLAGIGRLEEDRFVKHYCNKCEKVYEGSPALVFENPNEELGEGVTLIEKGEYKCRACNATIAQYRKFDAPAQTPQQQQETTSTNPVQATASKVEEKSQASPPSPSDLDTTTAATTTVTSDSFFPMQSLVGMSAYDSEAMLIGKVEQIGLRKVGGRGNAHIMMIKIGEKEVPWDGISKIGDIILLKTADTTPAASGGKCSACGYQNESDAAFCAECGTKL